MSGQVIAIDGPAASGKSTVARRVASALGWVYVDSGALYRAVAWKALKSGVYLEDAEAVRRIAENLEPKFDVRDGAVVFWIDGMEPGLELRTERVNANVSRVAALPAVRERVGRWLRSLTRFGNLVMEGRDIGTAVFPDAERKFYLDASPEVRAKRRHAEILALDRKASEQQVGESLRKRDLVDSTRAAAPLKAAPDAVVIDTTALSIDDVVKTVLAYAGGKGRRKNGKG